MDEKQKTKIATIQIFIMILSIIAPIFLISQSIETVSAADSPIIKKIPAADYSDPVAKIRTQSLMYLNETEIEMISKNYEAQTANLLGDKKDSFGRWESWIIRAIESSVTINKAIIAKNVAEEAAKKVAEEAAKEAAKKVAEGVAKNAFQTSTIGQILIPFQAAAYVTEATLLFFEYVVEASKRNMEMLTTSGLIATILGGGTGAALALTGALATGPAGWIAAGITAVVLAISFFISYKEYSQEVFHYQIGIWQPTGNDLCDKCNELEYGCSEYQCHTFGPNCVLINPNQEDSLCIKNESISSVGPIMSFNETSLPEGYKVEYSGNNVEILFEKGDLPCWEDLSFEINTDQHSQCRYSISDIGKPEDKSFEELPHSTNVGITSFKQTHFVYFPNYAFPSMEKLSDDYVKINPDYSYVISFICKNTNEVVSNFPLLVTFSLDNEPDMTAPSIKNMVPESGGYLIASEDSQKVKIITNEPANCKWSIYDKPYEYMENNMSNCSQTIYDFPYGCTANFTNIVLGENNFYVRCEDKPNKTEDEISYSNKESKEYIVTKTSELKIEKILISTNKGSEIAYEGSETKKIYLEGGPDSNQINLIVKSVGGHNPENAICTYKYEEKVNEYKFQFKKIEEGLNKQKITLENGINNFTIECKDSIGNNDSANISLEFKLDKEAPTITNMWYESKKLFLKTNEESTCYYSFEYYVYNTEEEILESNDKFKHEISLDTDLPIYIVCQDEYGNPNDLEENGIKIQIAKGFN